MEQAIKHNMLSDRGGECLQWRGLLMSELQNRGFAIEP